MVKEVFDELYTSGAVRASVPQAHTCHLGSTYTSLALETSALGGEAIVRP